MEKYILVIEDEPFIQKLLVKFMEAAHYTPVVAENGAVALELLETIAFDLITFDLNMPIMDGNQFLDQLSAYAPTIPVLVISGDLEELKPHPQIMANLAKPFQFDQLLTVLMACLS